MPQSDEKPPHDQFDVPWKDILDAYFPDFLEFFLPVAFVEIDWSRGFEFLNTELARISRDADIGDRRMDKLVKVWRLDGKKFWVLIHIEIQGNRKSNFASGMYVFQYRAYDLYQVPVVGLAILADEEVGWRPTEFGYDIWGTKQSYQFTAVKLLDYTEAELERSTNPFAIVTLAHLHAKKTKHLTEDRYLVKRHMVFGLYQKGFSRKQIIDLFKFIDWVMHLTKELDDQLNVEILEYEENQNMPYISSMERFLEERMEKRVEERVEKRVEERIEKRIEERVEKRGEKKGETKMLIRLLQRRFGELPIWASEKLDKADLSSLEEWGLRILDAQSLDAVFADRV